MNTFRSAAALLLLGALPACADDPATPLIRRLTREMGYVAGIHHFKNFVLRGTDSYRTGSDEAFAAAEKTIGELRALKLTDKELEGLNGIEKVVKQYRANLPVAQKMHGEGKKIEEIDSAVRVDDGPAESGLDALRAGRTWTALDKIEALIGFGKGIHDFKNYVLRKTDAYKKDSEARLKETLEAIAELRGDKGLDEAKRKALEDVESTVKKYAGMIPVAEKMIGEGKGSKEIDTAVKVDDGPATKALEILRK